MKNQNLHLDLAAAVRDQARKDAIRAEKRQRRNDGLALVGHLLKWLLPIAALFVAAILLATGAWGTPTREYVWQCQAQTCEAWVDTPTGPVKKTFRKGTVIGEKTAHPVGGDKGWVKIDGAGR